MSSISGLKVVSLLSTLIVIFQRKSGRCKELDNCSASVGGARIAWVRFLEAYLVIWMRRSAGCVTDMMPHRGGKHGMM
jgi:hypothetical protein